MFPHPLTKVAPAGIGPSGTLKRQKMQEFKGLVDPELPIGSAIKRMGASEANKMVAGILVVVDPRRQVIGVVTDGDLRRGLAAGASLLDPVSSIANQKPFLLSHTMPLGLMWKRVKEECKKRGVTPTAFDKLILVAADGKTFHDLIKLADVVDRPVSDRMVVVYGLGFVGLTVAATLANFGIHVTGVESNKAIIEKLERNDPPFFEHGLRNLLETVSRNNPIEYRTNPGRGGDIHLVCVGTPVSESGKPDLTSLTQVTEEIARVLEAGDMVIYRSTVPLGTTRQTCLPILESISGLRGGQDFSVAFAPERTIEGRALKELQELPQIIGGIDKRSGDRAAQLFRVFTSATVLVDSLEAAELVKLMNNTFRDLVFSFANEVATICDALNVDAFRLIEAANEGYPRNPIPKPSPGVGGFCLTKDPLLYGRPTIELPDRPLLGDASRKINSKGSRRVFGKIEQFLSRQGKSLRDSHVAMIGLAFKGEPETSDMRFSPSLELIDMLRDAACIKVFDFVVDPADMARLGVDVAPDPEAAFTGADIVLFMNNHRDNIRVSVTKLLDRASRPLLFFDGWHQFDRYEIERIPDATYATLGYMSTLK